MKTWFLDLWEGFSTVLIGMKITWRHLFVKKATLHYPRRSGSCRRRAACGCS